MVSSMSNTQCLCSLSESLFLVYYSSFWPRNNLSMFYLFTHTENIFTNNMRVISFLRVDFVEPNLFLLSRDDR